MAQTEKENETWIFCFLLDNSVTSKQWKLISSKEVVTTCTVIAFDIAVSLRHLPKIYVCEDAADWHDFVVTQAPLAKYPKYNKRQVHHCSEYLQSSWAGTQLADRVPIPMNKHRDDRAVLRDTTLQKLSEDSFQATVKQSLS